MWEVGDGKKIWEVGDWGSTNLGGGRLGINLGGGRLGSKMWEMTFMDNKMWEIIYTVIFMTIFSLEMTQSCRIFVRYAHIV